MQLAGGVDLDSVNLVTSRPCMLQPPMQLAGGVDLDSVNMYITEVMPHP